MPRLTKSDKQAFIISVMSDVPKIDYKEMTTELILNQAISVLPAAIKTIYQNPELKHWVKTGGISINVPNIEKPKYPLHLGYFYVPTVTCNMNVLQLTPDQQKQLYDWEIAEIAQSKKLDELRSRTEETIAGFNTVKQAREALPEFVNYLPEDIEVIKGLPSVTGMVTALVQAGWPDKKKRSKRSSNVVPIN